MKRFVILLSIVVLTLVGCATQQGVDRREPSRLVGKDNDVRIDAQVFSDQIGPGAQIAMTYEIQNLRAEPIAIADLIPVTEYDPDTQVITIQLGSEVPGNELLPRLFEIRSGETKVVRTAVRVDVSVARAGFRNVWPRSLRVRLSFLTDVKPFEMLIGIPERSVHDPALADELFMPWVNNHQFVTTNSIPVSWGGRVSMAPRISKGFSASRQTRGGSGS